MLQINIICIGKIKEIFFKDAINEYKKRLSKYCNLNIIELQDKKIPDKSNLSIINQVKNIESKEIILHLPKNSYNICLDLKGKQYSSEELANKISNLTLTNSSISFIIGGSLGFNDEVRSSCKESICFSKMTFPHQLIRVFLLEQIYRSFKIINGEEYHK